MSVITQYDTIADLAADQDTAREIARVLHHHYPPPHAWAVNVDSGRGIAVIENWNLSETHGFVIKLQDLKGAEEIRLAAIRAGGEFLERHDMSRTKKADPDELYARSLKARFN